jgi:hypothetical protein
VWLICSICYSIGVAYRVQDNNTVKGSPFAALLEEGLDLVARQFLDLVCFNLNPLSIDGVATLSTGL